MNWQKQLKGDILSWPLENDNPVVRYLVMRDLLDLSSDNSELIAGKELAHKDSPISIILNEMNEAGYWLDPGPGYNPKYRSTEWAIILLGQLGASIDMDERT